MNKKLFNSFRFIYKVGLIKSIFIFLIVFTASAEYEFKWKKHTLHLRKNSSDLSVFSQIFVAEQYKIQQLSKMQVKTIVDLGANVGLSIIDFKLKFPNATVIGVEPEKKNFDILEKNVATLSNVYCLNNAIWHSNKNLGIYDKGAGEYGYMIGDQTAEEIGTIKSLSVNDIIEQFQIPRIDILKIDIEGSEKELFSSNTELWLPKVGCIIIELHDWFRNGCASTFFKAINRYDYNISFKGENLVVVFNWENEQLVEYKPIKQKDFTNITNLFAY